MATRSYELYIMPSCPFCHRVLDYMDTHGIDIPLRDITSDKEAESTLIRVGGKRQVPCLFIDGKPMYESADIVSYLASTFA